MFSARQMNQIIDALNAIQAADDEQKKHSAAELVAAAAVTVVAARPMSRRALLGLSWCRKTDG